MAVTPKVERKDEATGATIGEGTADTTEDLDENTQK